MIDNNLIEGIFTESFCKKLWEEKHPGKAYYPRLNIEIARAEAWEMVK